jgi:CheY-like chemotaxis protein
MGRVLWIEDKLEQIRGFVDILNSDHSVKVAKTAEAALTEIQEALDEDRPYDVVILDIMLPSGEGDRIDSDMRPELMGEEILRWMRRNEACWPVIGVSAVADQQLRDRICKEFGFVVDVLKKPVKMDELETAISGATSFAE